ncbi:chromosome condensation protein CrcB [Streptomyces sp. NRRL F-4489]|uniref:fluoride efflux transporter FluC n=1 Tax=Streptomyces sp. NRRL F-4489 TaxID=1609095 RepID=UPI000749F901|nr:CrcB family protein [Streptomyces sp. NRRL F-4489]KUL53343.1 chromosome condensation protein CrcB [Streptomyces sp. NRRL F-4489]
MDERARRPLPWQGEWPVIGAVAAGGGIGAAARYGAGLLWPTAPGAFPWTTLLVNAAGCALMGVLMVLITEAWTAHRLLRPFLGTGILGGFTTFSTYTVDLTHLVDAGRLPLALAYLAGTLLAALTAVALAGTATRALLGLRRRTA